MSLVSLELGPLGYLLLILLAGTLFFWLRRWLRGRYGGVAAVVGAAVLAFGLTVLGWLLLLLLSQVLKRP